MGNEPTLTVSPNPGRVWLWLSHGVVLACAVLAVWGAVPYAGGYSDGSRLAAIESLGARGTLAVDDSVFIGYQLRDTTHPPAYDPANPHLVHGTADRMFVRGHFYSHHPPIPLILAGGLYRVSLLIGGPHADTRPDLFVRWITIATAGLPFIVAVWAVGRFARVYGLSGFASVLLPFSFGLATIAAAYSRQLNAHVVLLMVGAIACLLVARAEVAGVVSRGRQLLLGFTAGFGYCLDGGLGPALLLCLLAYCFSRGGWRGAMVAAVGAAPWIVAHHAVLFVVFGDPLSPASDPKNWDWPGSAFNRDNLTGTEIKHTATGTVEYGWRMAFGARGFLSHNIPLVLALPAAVWLAWRVRGDRTSVAVAVGWVILGTLPYLLGSDNLAGACLSVRWFVPFLAPGFWLIALLIRRRPWLVVHLAWLTVGGLYLNYHMMRTGPWEPNAPPRLDTVWTIALLGWAGLGLVCPVPPDPRENAT